jgi:Ca2+-binding RTX toxin-like protein
LIVDFSAATGAVSINGLAGTAAAGYAGNISGLGIATFAGVENFEITANVSNDTITTGDGKDTINGGGGNDVLSGGGDEDAFVFIGLSGHDEITDFEGGVDAIHISGWSGVVDFNDLVIDQSGTVATISNVSGDVKITLQDVDQQLVLAAEDFTFF